jgi:hypothetical protein
MGTMKAPMLGTPEDGLKHRYLVGVGVDPEEGDAEARGTARHRIGRHQIERWSAYSPRGAEAHVYRKTGEQRWEQSMSGTPAAKGTTVSRFATHAEEPGVIYAANTRGPSGQVMQDGAGRLWIFLGQSPGLLMAWRRMPVFRSDMERRSAVVSLCRLEINNCQLRWE